jgi:hypothetical protein
MIIAEISRYKVLKVKIQYWQEREKIVHLNALIKRYEDVAADRGAVDTSDEYTRLRLYRRTLLGRIRGVEMVMQEFGIPLDKEAAPAVTEKALS